MAVSIKNNYIYILGNYSLPTEEWSWTHYKAIIYTNIAPTSLSNPQTIVANNYFKWIGTTKRYWVTWIGIARGLHCLSGNVFKDGAVFIKNTEVTSSGFKDGGVSDQD